VEFLAAIEAVAAARVPSFGFGVGRLRHHHAPLEGSPPLSAPVADGRSLVSGDLNDDGCDVSGTVLDKLPASMMRVVLDIPESWQA